MGFFIFFYFNFFFFLPISLDVNESMAGPVSSFTTKALAKTNDARLTFLRGFERARENQTAVCHVPPFFPSPDWPDRSCSADATRRRRPLGATLTIAPP